MDFYSLGFIFVIVMVSGVIAYLADIWGRKLGKRRLSIFGLRPKHTAALGIVTLGMVLSVFTIGLVSVFSSPVRKWIVEGTKAQRDLRDLREQLNTLRNQVNYAELEVKEAKRQKQETQAEIAKYQQSIGANEVTLGSQKIQIANEQKSINSLKLMQAKYQSDLKETRLSLANKSREIQVDQFKIEDTDRKLKQNQHDLVKAQKTFEETVKSSREANRTLQARNTTLTEDISRQKMDLADLTQQRQGLEKNKADLQNELDTKQGDLRELNTRLAEETEQLSKIEVDYRWATGNVILSRTGDMVYRHQEEVCRAPVGANLTPEEADAAIDAFLAQAQTEAQHNGARSAELMSRPDGTTPEQIRALLKQHLTGKSGETALIASASINTFKDEPVPLDITLVPNPTVYHRGQAIGECDVDGTGSDQAIIKSLEDFGAKLTERARRDKMIPQNEESFGSLPAYQVMDLVDQVREAGRRVRLVAMVAQDTHAADALKLNFRIR